MSMSSSALASASASLVCACDACTGRDSGNLVPHSVGLPLPDQVNAPEFSLSNTGEAGAPGSGLTFENLPDPHPAGGSSSVGVDEAKLDVAEDSEHHLFQVDYQQRTCPDTEDTEPLVKAGEEFAITEESAGERTLSEPNLVDLDKVPRKKHRKGQANSWWKRQAVLWRHQSGKSSALWSVAVAATVLGIVIIGHRWQRERYQNQQLLLELSAKDEKLNDLMYQVNRLKEAITGRRRVPVMRSFSF